MPEGYTPGHSKNAVDFMSKRTLETHAAFVIPHLRDGMTVLDVGCGPGTITCGIAESIVGGQVVGLDVDESQMRLATETAATRGTRNVEFRAGSAFDLPAPSESFELVFAHALLEHLKDPARAVVEFRRVLRPAGTLAVCSPDWGGFLLAPSSKELAQAIEAYKVLQTQNGGDVYIGRKLSPLLQGAGFEGIQMQARYEVYDSLAFIGEYLAVQLEQVGEAAHAATIRQWAAQPNGMFAQAWVSCTGRRGTPQK